jgi:co-chaperonin GroES (HSP10)
MRYQVIPFGDRMLVRRRRTGDKAHGLYLPESASERPTDLADVVQVGDKSFADMSIIENAEEIITALTERARQGDSHALDALLKLNEFLRTKVIREGDTVFVGKYVGVDFHDSDSPQYMTLVQERDIIGLVRSRDVSTIPKTDAQVEEHSKEHQCAV